MFSPCCKFISATIFLTKRMHCFQKIARNQARLRELGLLQNEQKIRPNNPKKQKTIKSESKKPAALRRSRRLLHSPVVAWKEEEEDNKKKSAATTTTTTTEKRPKRPRPDKGTEEQKIALPRPASAANSVRGISINTEILVNGSQDQQQKSNGVLGIPMDRTKEFVIYESFERSACEEDRLRLAGSRLSFNKYSGVQEWDNAIFLWVNLGGKNNDVVNEFLDRGKQITWFGGSRMHDETPVVQRLLKLGCQTQENSIILWCRRYEDEKKTFGPYVCLGRLAYHSHVPGSYPLSFIWTLQDYAALLNHSDKAVGQRFHGFVDAAP